MHLRDVVTALETIAPTHLAEEWDNVGLIAGDLDQAVHSALLTIDYTASVAAEAAAQGCGLVVAYHPPLFKPVRQLLAGHPVYEAVRNGIALYSPHTALDVAEGGTNDMLADVLGLAIRQPLRPLTPSGRQYKLVTFVPEAQAERVSEALFAAGAGRIGNYSSCSFRSPGTGTFYGEPGSSPTVGKAGRMELMPEVRLETVVPIGSVSKVVQALRESHPYEEPAFDLVQLAAAPEGLGMGRICSFAGPVERAELLDRIRKGLGVSHLLVAGPTSGPVSRAAACAGSCGDLVDEALRQEAGLYLTGEMRHHDALRAASAGMTVVCVLHSNSERAVLRRLGQRLGEACPGLSVRISEKDRDPFTVL